MDGVVVGSEAGADLPVDDLEVRGVEDVVDGDGTDRVVSVPGGLEAAAFAGIEEARGLDEIPEGV